MRSITLAALAAALVLSGAASASASDPAVPGVAQSAQAWNVTKLRTHVIKHRHKRKAKRPSYEARMRALIRARYRAQYLRASDRFQGFAFHGDGFRTSGQYQ
ncbi:MAG: hypothetical protein AAGI06_06365 [Pseudomonadota bacterium]